MADKGRLCEQGYLTSSADGMTVRVRRIGDKGFLTIKGPSTGISRPELEYEIPVDEADHMLGHFCGDRIVSKTRYVVRLDGLPWEIDEFSGRNQGLILAEIELESVDQRFEKPDWLGEEVSSDSRYYNAALAVNPHCEWDI